MEYIDSSKFFKVHVNISCGGLDHNTCSSNVFKSGSIFVCIVHPHGTSMKVNITGKSFLLFH